MRRALLFVALLAHLACVSDNHAEWWIGDVAADAHDCHAIAGQHAVLDLQEFSSKPLVPFAWGGYRLFIQTEPSLLKPGATFSLPGPQAKALLCDLRHGASGDPAELSGTVDILQARGADLFVRFDLHDGENEWELSEERWFERQGTPTSPP